MNFVKVFYSDISGYFDADSLDARKSEVSAERLVRIERAKRPETKAQLLGAGLLVRAALKAVYGRDDFVFEVSPSGKPYISNTSGIFFNLSHAGKFVLCAVSNAEVGADIEEIAEAQTVMGIADRFFPVLERDAIALSPSPAEAFCRLWTLRESYVKMRGTGFDRGLAPLSCEFPSGNPKMLVDGVLQSDAFFTEIRDIYLCRGAVCTLGEAEFSLSKLTL